MSRSETCCICGVSFVRGPKGYNRRKVTTLTSPKTFKLVFDITPDDSSFLCWTCVGVLRRKTKQNNKLWIWSNLPTKHQMKRGRPRKALSNQSPVITNPSSLSREEECVPSKKTKRRPVRHWDGEKWITITSGSPVPHSTPITQPQTTIAATTHSASAPLHQSSNQLNSLTSQTSKRTSDLLSTGERPTESGRKVPQSSTHCTPLPSFPTEGAIRPEKKKLPVSRTKQSYTFSPNAKALYYMHNHKHLMAFRALMKTKARDAMTLFLAEIISRESKMLMKDQRGPFRQPLTEANVSGFSWDAVLTWGKEKAPITLACLNAMFPKPNAIPTQVIKGVQRNKRLRTEEVAGKVINQRVGLILAIVLFTSMQRCNFFQAFLGAEFWKQGCPPSVLEALNALGVCPSVASTKRYAERLTTRCDPCQQNRTEEVVEDPEKSFFGSKDESPILTCPEKCPAFPPTHFLSGSLGQFLTTALLNESSRDGSQDPTENFDSKEYLNLSNEHDYHRAQTPLLSQLRKNREDQSEVDKKHETPKQMKMTKNNPAISPPVLNASETYHSVMEASEVIEASVQSSETSQVKDTHVELLLNNTNKEHGNVSKTNVENVQMSGESRMNREPKRGRPRKELAQVSKRNVKDTQTSKKTCTHLEPTQILRRGRPRKKPFPMAQITDAQNKPIQVLNTHMKPAETNEMVSDSVAQKVRPEKRPHLISRKRQSNIPQVSDTNENCNKIPKITLTKNKESDEVIETCIEPAQRRRRGSLSKDPSKILRGRTRKGPIDIDQETEIHTEGGPVPQLVETSQKSVQVRNRKKKLIGTPHSKQTKKEPAKKPEEPVQMGLMPKRKKGRPRKEIGQICDTSEETPSVHKISNTVREPALTRGIKIIVNRMERNYPAQMPKVSEMDNEPVQVSEENMEPVQRSGQLIQMSQINGTNMEPGRTILKTTSTAKRLEEEPVQKPQANKTNTELEQTSHILETIKKHIDLTSTNNGTAVPILSCIDKEAAEIYKINDRIKEEFQNQVIRIVDTRMRVNKELGSVPQVNEHFPEPAMAPEISNSNNQPTRVIRIVVNRRVAAGLCSPARKGLDCLAEVAAKCAPLDVKSAE